MPALDAHQFLSPFDGFHTRAVPWTHRGFDSYLESPLVQSTTFFNCSSVKKIKIVVGWSRVHAGTQPLNMNIAPSFFSEVLITPMVLFEPGPEAFIMRLCSERVH